MVHTDLKYAHSHTNLSTFGQLLLLFKLMLEISPKMYMSRVKNMHK